MRAHDQAMRFQSRETGRPIINVRRKMLVVLACVAALATSCGGTDVGDGTSLLERAEALETSLAQEADAQKPAISPKGAPEKDDYILHRKVTTAKDEVESKKAPR